jgi:glycosyltransferase involved in cell wall biosynthesis
LVSSEITVGVPFFGDPAMLARCVKSLRGQTHKDLRILVIGDGQKPGLRVRDSRVQVHTLPANRGAYFTRAVALAATDTPWHGVVDSDDWVDPGWAETLLAAGGDAVQHGSRWVEQEGQPAEAQVWRHARRPLARNLLHYTSHAGIYTTARLRDAGGYSPAYRVGYDSLLVSVLRILGPIKIVDEPLYHRSVHGASLSRAEATKIGSPYRVGVREELDVVYRKAYRLRSKPERVRQIVAELTPEALWDEVAEQAEKVRRG